MEVVLELQTCYWKLSWVLHCVLVIVYAHRFALGPCFIGDANRLPSLESYLRLHQENVVSILEYLA